MRAALLALVAVLLLPCGAAVAQVTIPDLQAQPFAYEDEDAGVAPTTDAKRTPNHAPTPTSIPGGRVIRTMQLKQLLAADKDVVVVDVLDTKTRRTVPGAVWVPDGGYEPKYAAERSHFADSLDKATGGNKERPVVFLCLNSHCWLSYNAALDAIALGYRDVIWFRGGTDAWRGASLHTAAPRRVE